MSVPRRDVLERVFPAPHGAFERLARRRQRRDRNRRIVEGGVAIALVVVLVAALVGAIATRRPKVPAGPITHSNVGELGLAWWGSAAAPADSQPIVAGDRVYVVARDGTLSAFPSECASERCDPVWSARSGIGSSRPWGSAIVSGDRVYQPTSIGRLVGHPTSCDADPCEPDWIGAASGDLTSASPVAADGMVFVASDECCHGSRSYGRLFAFDESCASYPTACRPSWTATLPSGFIGAQPVVAGDRVYVGALDGRVYAFPTRCAPARGGCEPLWTAETHGRYAANFGFGLPLHSLIVTPLIANGSTLYVAAGSSVYAFPLVCRTSPCPPEWIGHVGGWINDIGVSAGHLYASAEARVGQGRQAFAGGTVVFPTSCVNRCRPVWTFESNQSSPIVADGVLFLLGSGEPGDQAFDASCGRGGGGETCDPLWTMAADNGGSVNFPSIANDAVYVSGTDGNLHVFKLGGSATCCPVDQGTPGSRNSLAYLLFYGLAVAGSGWLVVRRRARARLAA
jgi:outer membrane protein assembly factor BamB